MPSALFTESLNTTYAKLRNSAHSRPDLDWRIGQLKALKALLQENDDAINRAMWADLRKSSFECMATEQGIVLSEIKDALKHLSKWMRPKRVQTPLYNFPGRCKIQYDPFGLTLIIGAWNYPVNLLLAPLVGAIAGGNAAILKPSEISANTAHLINELVPKYMDTQMIAVIEGGPDETDALLDLQFDLIFFTGSGPVGKLVMGKAAQHLTPVVLELGGKSPAIVMSDTDIEVCARRITWGKFMNAGQTCVAPDYVLVESSVKARLIQAIQQEIKNFYGEDPQANPDYCRIVNAKNFNRLVQMLKTSKIISGGRTHLDDLYIEPTLVVGNTSDELMKNEIFGPILPILEIANSEEAIDFVNSHAKPLALYLFTADTRTQDNVLQRTSSGGVCLNDVIMHMPVAGLPFGGVGASGMGHYHGEFSFKTFTHAKGILHKANWLDLPLRYPPYSKAKANWLRRLF